MIIAITHVFNNILEKTHIGTGSLYQYFGGYTNVSRQCKKTVQH